MGRGGMVRGREGAEGGERREGGLDFDIRQWAPEFLVTPHLSPC